MNRIVLGIFSFFTLILTVSAMNYNMPVDNNICVISDINKSEPCCEIKDKVSSNNSCQKQCCYNKSK